MKALVYKRSVPHYLASKLTSFLAPRKFFPNIVPLSLQDITLKPQFKDWAVLKTVLCGICGSDLHLLRAESSFIMEPYTSFPAVLGHEILAKVEKAPENSNLTAGQRVVVEPILSCESRGLPLCEMCRQGFYNLCENTLYGKLPPGAFLGFTRDVPGGFAEYLQAHPSRILTVPESLSDEDAVLVDSLGSALHPVLWNFPKDKDTVLVVGLGILGQHVIRSLRFLGSKARIIALGRHPLQAELAKIGGVDEILEDSSRKALAEAVGGKFVSSTLGGGNIEGGADLIFDCVGSSSTLENSLISLKARGTYVLVGAAGKISKADISSLWFRELRLVGTSICSTAPLPPENKMVRVYEQALNMLAGGYSTKGLLTHLFPLDSWKEAFKTAFDKRRQSMKVAFDFR